MLKPIILKNGLTVLRIPKTNSRATTIGFVIPSGSSSEEGYFPQGISHLIERLFWCGTDKHPSKRSLNLALESIGGNFTSLTSHEYTGYYLTVPEYHQSKAISMLAEIIQHSYFDSRDIASEKKIVIEQLKDQIEDFEVESQQLGMNTLYANSSLGLPVRGSLETVSSVEQGDILEYLSHQYLPDKAFLILAGSFENKNVTQLVDQEWSLWNPKPKKFIEPMNFQPEDVGELPRIIYRQRGISQTFLTFSFLLDGGLMPSELIAEKNSEEPVETNYEKVRDETLRKNAILMILNTLLGQGLSSRLYSKTVEEEMLFTNIQSNIHKYKTTGFLEIAGLIENSQFSFGLESVLTVLEAFKKTTVSINELAKAKEYLKGRLILEDEDLFTSVVWQVENLLGSGLNYQLEDLINKIDSIEAPELRALADNLFNAERMIIASLGTAKETRLVEKLIKKYLG